MLMTKKKLDYHHLTEADARAWLEITKSIKRVEPKNPKTKLNAHGDKRTKPAITTPPANLVLPNVSNTHLEISRRERGDIVIDAKLDLHGFTEAQAFDKLIAFVQGSFLSGHRMLLIITGKGTIDRPSILKSRVHAWINNESIAPLIIKASYAAKKHGGEGAFYLYLRKAKNRA
jgi:DNA-nicking Smr family endonuclease